MLVVNIHPFPLEFAVKKCSDEVIMMECQAALHTTHNKEKVKFRVISECF